MGNQSLRCRNFFEAINQASPSLAFNFKALKLGIALALVHSRQVSVGHVAATKRHIGLELLLLVRSLVALLASQALVVRVRHLQTHIVFFVSLCNLRVVITEFANADVVWLVNKACLNVSLLLSLLLLQLRRLPHVILLKLDVAHLVVILIRHRQPGVTQKRLSCRSFRRLPLQDG